MVVFELNSYARASHTPDPSPEVSLGSFIVNESVIVFVAPLEKGLRGMLRRDA